MTILPRLLLLALLSSLSGCAFSQADLDVRYDPAAARVGPLSEVPSTKFALAEFEDGRINRMRIGYKRNTLGMNTADVKTNLPVEQIVRDAVQATFEENGHVVGSDGAVRIEGEVTQFWFDTQTNFWTVEFMGTVACKLKLVDATSGAPVYESEYIGHYNEKSAGGYEKSWARVMNLALARLVEMISFDAKLADALKAREAGS